MPGISKHNVSGRVHNQKAAFFQGPETDRLFCLADQQGWGRQGAMDGILAKINDGGPIIPIDPNGIDSPTGFEAGSVDGVIVAEFGRLSEIEGLQIGT